MRKTTKPGPKTNKFPGSYESEDLGEIKEFSNPALHKSREYLDPSSYVNLVQRCTNAGSLPIGKKIHAYIITKGHSYGVFLDNLLVHMYGKCGALVEANRLFERINQRNVFSWSILMGSYLHSGCLDYAHKLFEEMPERNVVSWTTMIQAYAKNGYDKEARQLYRQMQDQGVIPDRVTLLTVLEACSNHEALAEGKRAHAQIVENDLEISMAIRTALVNMYAKCGDWKNAKALFSKSPEKDVILWSAMITAYTQHGNGSEALSEFWQMQLVGSMPNEVTFTSILSACAQQVALFEGRLIHSIILDDALTSDVAVGNALLNMYSKCGSMNDCLNIFDTMINKDLMSWNIMIEAFAQHGYYNEAFHVFERLRLQGMTPDKCTFVSIINSCANGAAFTNGKQIHKYILEIGLETNDIGTALVSMYAKCGFIGDAQAVFEANVIKDVQLWTAMIAAYSQYGFGEGALQLFQQMHLEGVMPNIVTFTIIVYACSHSGLVDEGIHYFTSMSADHNITVILKHCHCLIHLLGRLGWADEAEHLIDSMPCEATSLSWITLLASCFDVEQGRRAALNSFELDPGDATPYVLLSNLYAAAGQWKDAMQLRDAVKQQGLQERILDKMIDCCDINLSMRSNMCTLAQVEWKAMAGE